MRSPSNDKLIAELAEEELMRRNREAIALVETWMKEDPAYDLATLPLLKKALNASREEVDARRLFHDEGSRDRECCGSVAAAAFDAGRSRCQDPESR